MRKSNATIFLIFRLFAISIFALFSFGGHATAKPPTKEQIAAAPVGFPYRNGSFSAQLYIIEPSNTSEIESPSGNGLAIGFVEKAHVGQIVQCVILFHGAEISRSNEMNVTYDLKIYAPDGNLYDGTDVKGLVGYVGQTSAPHHIYNSQAVVSIRFEDRDLAGVYRTIATIKDNNSGRKIELSSSVTLLK